MRSGRALSILFASTFALVACGGLLGFGDDDDDGNGEPPAPPPDAAADATTEPSDDPDSSDASASIDAIATTDAPLDATDQTPVDAGPGGDLLVEAHFEDHITGPDGADDALNMVATKAGLIAGAKSAISEATHPAYVGWVFPSQDKVFVTFSMRVVTMPTAPGAEVLQLKGTGGTVGLAIGGPSNAVFAVRSDGVTAAGAKVQAGTVYRVGLEIDRANKIARAGLVDGTNPTLGLQIAWANPGSVDSLVIGALTNQAAFSVVVDDVFVSTKGLK